MIHILVMMVGVLALTHLLARRGALYDIDAMITMAHPHCLPDRGTIAIDWRAGVSSGTQSIVCYRKTGDPYRLQIQQRMR